MSVLALDAANTTGWAHYKDGTYRTGVWDLSVLKKQGEARGHRYLNLYLRLNSFHSEHQIELLVYEKPGRLFGHAREILLGLQGMAEFWGAEQAVPVQMVSPTEVKMFATGRGKCSKETMIAAAKRKWPDLELTADQADAMWLLEYGLLKRKNPRAT